MLDQKYWDRIEKTETCWNWKTWITDKGYGMLECNGKRIFAHRFVYEALVGKIPAGLVIDHLCRNTRCVNPTHLEPVTNAENLRRGYCVSAVNSRKKHCKYGHELAGDGIQLFRGERICRACRKRRNDYHNPRRKLKPISLHVH